MNNKIVGIVSLLSMLSVSAVQAYSYATSTGFYLGGQVGLSKINAPSLKLTNCPVDVNGIPFPGADCTPKTINPSTTGAAGRVFLGYSFYDWFALEGGYSYFTPANYNIEICPSKGGCGNPTIGASAFDFVGKLMYTFCNTIGVFAKAGLAITYYKVSGSLNGAALPNGAIPTCGSGQVNCGHTQNFTKLRGTYGVGLSYNLSPNWITDLSYTVISGSSNQPKIDFVALGISYHFVDLYCGQFLC